MLEGRRFLVVGATGGLGAAVARGLAAGGARVAVSGRDRSRLDALAAELGAPAMAADLRDRDAADRVVAFAAEALGGLDGMVNAAGVVAFGAARDLRDDVIDELVAVDLVAAMRLTRAALAHLGRGGVVVNVSAVVADMPTAGMAAYSAVKAGLTAFDAAVAREARRDGVRLIDARPPHTETGLASRPVAGSAPRLAPGRDPQDVAARIVAAVADADAREVVF